MDKIIIKGMEVFAYHGVNSDENRDGQNFKLNIVIYLNINESDKIEQTVNYSKVAKLALKVMQEDKYNLIETAAKKVALQILKEFLMVKKVKITLKKPDAPMKLKFDYVGVKITMKRGSLEE
ncbi:MAG: dihydroneopterin aldolase [Oscillospiraceae bacterium]|jgi:dihydroneopterin aldolase|nr:dihydroneopterin aldolase [Oscillospiraceae bacterium]